MFKIPVDGLHEQLICNILKNSALADLLCAVILIIWDEVSAQHRHAVEAVNRTLQDIRNNSSLFGGITVVLGGDWRQTLPVVSRGTKDIIDTTLQRSHLWHHVIKIHLTENMRLDPTNADVQDFAQWLREVGEGKNMVGENQIHIPDRMHCSSKDDLISFAYPGVSLDPSPPPPAYFFNCMILAPQNAEVSHLNQEILDQMLGEACQYISTDQIIQEEDVNPANDDPIPVEFLQSIDTSGLPLGDLNLKVGCPVILMRNLAPKRGLCNGTRMIITQMRDWVLEVQLIGGDFDGTTAMIPRIALMPNVSSDFSFRFKHLQYPVRLAFVLSIHKAHIGLYLCDPVFSHGRLYVALSRVTASRNIKILLPEDVSEFLTTNVVYREILL